MGAEKLTSQSTLDGLGLYTAEPDAGPYHITFMVIYLLVPRQGPSCQVLELSLELSKVFEIC